MIKIMIIVVMIMMMVIMVIITVVLIKRSNEANYDSWALSKNKGMDDANMVRMMMLMMVCGSVVVQIYISRYSTNDFVWSL